MTRSLLSLARHNRNSVHSMRSLATIDVAEFLSAEEFHLVHRITPKRAESAAYFTVYKKRNPEGKIILQLMKSEFQTRDVKSRESSQAPGSPYVPFMVE